MPKSPLIVEVGQALYGPHWVRPLAEALKVSERTMRYWQDGEREPPPGVLTDARRLCLERVDTLKVLAGRLKS